MSERREDEPFLSRWSRRKRDGRTEIERAPNDTRPSETDIGERAEPTIDLASLPKLDELTAESDIRVFLQRGVPDLLKQQALRRMWSLDPTIRDFVEMAENQYDWNIPGGVPGFGDLDPGTDVTALLDQALGRWPGRDAPQDTSTDEDPAKRKPPQPAVASGADGPRKEREAMPPLETAEAQTVDADQGPPRPRHGGALPA